MAGVATPSVGDLLADRYSLAAHVNDDSSGRQVWRGMDILLNRPVTVVMRTPGGAEAEEMLAAAVAASRVNHPNVVGVYDAVDQDDCAYVVREWVEGQALRDSIAASRLPAEDAVKIVQCVCEGVAAVHEAGVAHGNIHPGTILLSEDDRVVLADPRAEGGATNTGDVRALAATLYCALVGGWPRTVPGPASLPDAPTDGDGNPLPPNEIRPELPERVNRLVRTLLDPEVVPPSAKDLADELDRLNFGPDTGTLAIVTNLDDEPDDEPDESGSGSLKPSGRQLAYGAAVLGGLAVLGLLAAILVIVPGGQDDDSGSGAAQGGRNENNPERVEFSPENITVIDPSGGDSSAPNDMANLVDGDGTSNWATNEYNQQDWGGYMDGMGLMFDLGKKRDVVTVTIDMPVPENEVGVYAGKEGLSGDVKVDDLDVIAKPQKNGDNDLKFTVGSEAPETRYVLIWCSTPAPANSGYQWTVSEIDVHAR